MYNTSLKEQLNLITVSFATLNEKFAHYSLEYTQMLE